jgi:hypothetical protein
MVVAEDEADDSAIAGTTKGVKFDAIDDETGTVVVSCYQCQLNLPLRRCNIPVRVTSIVCPALSFAISTARLALATSLRAESITRDTFWLAANTSLEAMSKAAFAELMFWRAEMDSMSKICREEDAAATFSDNEAEIEESSVQDGTDGLGAVADIMMWDYISYGNKVTRKEKGLGRKEIMELIWGKVDYKGI